MFKDRNQFNLFIKEMDGAIVEQVFQDTIADVCLNGGNQLRELMDSYSVFLNSGDFNMNMRDFEGKLSEFLVPCFSSNLAIYEATRLSEFDTSKSVEAIDDFNLLKHLRECLGQDHVFMVIQNGIKGAHSWLN